MSGAIDQAERYARDITETGGITFVDGAPWQDEPHTYRVPFVFASNGCV